EWDAIDGNHYQVNGENPVGDISSFSSWGPRRDGGQKPDLAAPGSWIMSAWADQNQVDQSQIDPGGEHKIISGTSMATPHVAGVIALMLEKDPTLTPAEVKSLLTSTARTDGWTGSVWNQKWGYGKLDAEAAVDAVGGGGPGNCPTTMGDANQDNSVNILDVIEVVNHILSIEQLDGDGQACSDTNEDESIDILDVIGIVNIILGKAPPPLATTLADDPTPLAWGQGIDETSFRLVLDGSRVGGLEMMFVLPRGFELAGDPALDRAAPTATVAIHERLGQHVLVAYDPTGEPLGSTEAPLVLRVPLERTWNGGEAADRFAVTRLLVADPEGRALSLADEPTLEAVGPEADGGIRASFHAVAPNPLRDVSQISYELPRNGAVTVTVYDPSGRKVRTLWDGWQMAGGHSLPWDGTNDFGKDLGAGIYFVRLEGEGIGESRKLTVVR
ncbi:MAG: S8 family serine peptidase, partial [Candidatus Eisenbacteria bacterium]|nr:S8 family serine peptidase [Candidatus Latescibacterota bacterium]MBD3302828.1 S8 family serine peptidase [Candidatus Eisenbacteria bacterium]